MVHIKKIFKKKKEFVDISLFFFFWPHSENLVPQPEIEPVLPAVEAQSLNHWTAREVPVDISLKPPHKPRSFDSRTSNLMFLCYKAKPSNASINPM